MSGPWATKLPTAEETVIVSTYAVEKGKPVATPGGYRWDVPIKLRDGRYYISH